MPFKSLSHLYKGTVTEGERKKREFGKTMHLASMEMDQWSNNGKVRMKMEEKAKQELEMLESQYPNHFDYLKLELKSFIFQLQCQQQQLPENSTFQSSIANTQESTSLNQRKRKTININGGYDSSDSEYECANTAEHYSGKKKKKKKKNRKRRDRVDEVLERAQACLEKIQHFKTSLLSNS